MSNLDKKYNRFELKEDFREHLLRLSNPGFPLRQEQNQVVVETVVIEEGRRKILQKETKDA